MKDLRPIALCNVILKIITKVLANRLKSVLPRVISETQSAFLKGRLITDNVLLAFELLHTMKRNTRKKKGEVAMKIDISKAYDRMDWNYLRLIMLKLGFSTQWVYMIMVCVTSVRYFVRVNDQIVGPITPKRGLRQGDPLSPYLFIICMEGLSMLIQDAERRGMLHGCRVGRGAPPISHLLFADDVIFFCRVSLEECRTLKGIFNMYKAASGQAINFGKSGYLCSNNVAPELQEGISFILGVSNPINTGRYLGLPSLVGKNKFAIFNHLKDKLWRRLQSWRQRPTSKAGRATLIKAAAHAIPVYYMSVFMLPSTTVDELQRMLNSFWWGSKKDGSRSWDKLCVPKKFGGLGFRNFTAFNLAMLGKQGWRLMSTPDTLVSKVFKAKYYPQGDFLEARLGHSPSFIWRSVWYSQLILKKGYRWKIGSGNSIRVWKDPWLRDVHNMRIETPIIEELQDLRVSDLFKPNTLDWDDIKLHQLFSHRDVKEIRNLPPRIENMNDRMIWHGSQKGIYTVKSGYRLVVDVLEPTSQHFIEGSWSKIWQANIPHKVRYFAWRAVRNLLPTRVNLQKRGLMVPCNCLLCGRNLENTWHLFVDCPFAEQVWREVDLWDLIDEKVGIANGFADLFFSILNSYPASLNAKFLMIFWGIWNRRNESLWNNNTRAPTQIVRIALEVRGDRVKANLLRDQTGTHESSRNCELWHKPPIDFL